MLATIIHAPRDIRVETVPDPVLSTGGDAIVRVVAACVCGSDLWPYRGVTPTHDAAPHRPRVRRRRRGGRRRREAHRGGRLRDRPVLRVRQHLHQLPQRRLARRACTAAGGAATTGFGGFADGGQGERVRVPLADGTLVPVRDADPRRPGARPAHPLRRDGHRPPRRGLRRRPGRATRSRSSATEPSGSAPSSRRSGSGRRRSSRCRGIPSARPSPATSAPRTSSPSAATSA